MVEDPSKRSVGERDGVGPGGQRTSNDQADIAREADSIVRLLKARLELPDLRQSDPAEASGAFALTTRPSDPGEMTPTPMVMGASGELTPAAPSANASSVSGWPLAPDLTSRELADLDAGWGEGDEPVGDRAGSDSAGETVGTIDSTYPPTEGEPETLHYPQYHPPRPPPTSIAPPPAQSSFSVAPEYDPKAPTKPKVRRNTSIPPAPVLFGVDRMLVWGLVLGGLFVAAIVVIVHQFALSERNAGVREQVQSPVESGSPNRTMGAEASEPRRQGADAQDSAGTTKEQPQPNAAPEGDAGLGASKATQSASPDAVPKPAKSANPKTPHGNGADRPPSNSRALWIE